MTTNVETMDCPFCGEEIKAVAQKCKHCGEFLKGGTQGSSAKASTKGQYANLVANINLAVPAVASGLLLFSHTMYSYEATKLINYTCIGTVLITSILLAIDAAMVGVGMEKDGKRRTGPIGWFISGLLLWFLSYPSYYFTRSKYTGDKKFFFISLGITALFTIILFTSLR